MRALALLCLVPLAACAWDPAPYNAFTACAGLGQGQVDTGRVLYCAGLEDKSRVEAFAAGEDGHFSYAAQTNTVMTENEDGAAERIRRQWLAEALQANAMCPVGYVVDNRRFVQDTSGPFVNGGDIVYAGRCLGERLKEPAKYTPVPRGPGERAGADGEQAGIGDPG